MLPGVDTGQGAYIVRQESSPPDLQHEYNVQLCSMVVPAHAIFWCKTLLETLRLRMRLAKLCED